MSKPGKYSPSKSTETNKPLSVIICAKNEARNLEKHLPEICSLDYNNYEVIVVNDCSIDDTELVLAKLKQSYPNLYYTNIPANRKFFHGKKLALTIGIKAAKHEHLIFTDADCRPLSDQWLKEISSNFSDSKEIVIGHGRYAKHKTLFNLFLRYETFWHAVQYFGFALRGRPFMAVGRNLAYKKSLFVENNVFKPFLNIASGDDDLFIKTCATNKNTAIQINRNSQTESIPPKNISEWFERKSRHLTTAKKYRFGIKWWLFMEPFTRQIFWLLTLYLLFFPNFAPIGIALFVLRFIVVYLVLSKASGKMGENKLYLSAILFDFIIPTLIASVWVINIFSTKKNKWK